MLILSPGFIQTSFASDSSIVTGKYTLICNGNYYDIGYQIANAKISNFTTHSNLDMIFNIQNSTHGTLTVDLPPDFTKGGGFSLAPEVNDHLLNISYQRANATDDILVINLPNGNFELKFGVIDFETIPVYHVNCSVVPEFGSLAVMMITASIIGSILIQRRFRY